MLYLIRIRFKNEKGIKLAGQLEICPYTEYIWFQTGEGKWQEYCQKVNYVQELENFAGLLYICKLRWNLEDNH